MNTYIADQELPALGFEWSDNTGNLIDFSTGWTFSAIICAHGSTTALATKTAGITGANTAPNVVIDWAGADFAPLPTGKQYDVYLKARRTSDLKDRYFRPGNVPWFTLLPAPL